eukprot:scaffold297_cov386-Prasinococcus_capsulatus_cf.AAC.8
MANLTGVSTDDIEVTDVEMNDELGTIVVEFTIMFEMFDDAILLPPDDLSDLIQDDIKLIDALLTLPILTGTAFVATGTANVVLLVPPPAPPVSVISDPHFRGFHNQTYDVTGVAGRIYNIISDAGFRLNAVFATAYTSGIFVEPESGDVMKMRPKGTWMVGIGIVLEGLPWGSNSFIVSTEKPQVMDEVVAEACQLKPQDCFARGAGGSVTVNGTPVVDIGQFTFGKLAIVARGVSQASR